MKIGILTLPFNNNYGGYLQAYALMTVLKGMGHEVELIYRRLNRHSLKRKLSHVVKTIIKIIIGREHDSIILNQEKEFRKKGAAIMPFVDTMLIPRTKKIYTTKELKYECGQSYDACIVGSDQIWRPEYVSDISNYFLDFVDEPQTIKLSYAASFGIDNPKYSEREKQICGDLISRFNAVSVREESGIDVIRRFGWNAKNEEVVLDPTMLLDIKEYKRFLEPIDKDYVMSYILDMNEEKRSMMEDISKALLLPMINLSIKDKRLPSMETWLSSLYYAKFIITDSFHGTVFAILFNRPFIVWANKKRGIDRFTTLLKTFGLENRMVFDNNGVMELIKEKVDWISVNQKLEINRKKSIAFLTNVLEKTSL